MIQNLTLKNFRAFRSQSFEFSKINVFVGPNNSGKSSALSAINLIAQTVLGAELGGSPLILNGQFEQLGTYIDTVHGNHPTTPIGISMGYNNAQVELEFKYRSQRREIELSRFLLRARGKEVYARKSSKYAVKTSIFGVSESQYHKALDALETRDKGELMGFWPYENRFRYWRIGKDAEKDHELKETVKNLERAERELLEAWFQLRSQFRCFDTLGAFRDPPQRTYLYTGESATHVGKTGSNSIAQLINDASKRGSQSSGFVTEVSRWLAATGIAKRLAIRSLTPRHFEVCLEGHDKKIHNICDVGFGCSQVLPVIVGGLNAFSNPTNREFTRTPPIFLVQEPEIHLHPNAQASLASFFVGQVKKKGQLFIETHSDNLVLRLARHVALGDIKPDDVTIFIVSDEGGGKVVRMVRPDATGVFKPEWPGGFFPQRQGESLALARARLKRNDKAADQMDFFYPEEEVGE